MAFRFLVGLDHLPEQKGPGWPPGLQLLGRGSSGSDVVYRPLRKGTRIPWVSHLISLKWCYLLYETKARRAASSQWVVLKRKPLGTLPLGIQRAEC